MTHVLKRNIAPANALGWTCVFLLTAAYVAAIVHGVVSIDVARDLYWGQRIVVGEALPLIGPPVGTTMLLGPVWYYLVAAVLAVSGSLTAYFSLMGCLLVALSLWLLVTPTLLSVVLTSAADTEFPE